MTACSRDAVVQRLRVRVTGVVQGVGFRPFVHRTARGLRLTGCVCNTFGGADIEIEGPRSDLDAFLQELQERPPPIARIDRVEVTDLPPCRSGTFEIVESAAVGDQAALISPDVAVCADCLREMRDPSNRRALYPFINCTNCGPRFTIVTEVPYDRPKTTMAHFRLCEECDGEYRDPADRRYHAQPNACPRCGPQVRLLDGAGAVLADRSEAIARAQQMLTAGAIVAVKGLGGFHLACNAANSLAVAALRRRKNRPHKPLAVMFRDRQLAEAYCLLDSQEIRELEHPRRPILLLRRQGSLAAGLPPIAVEVAPKHGDLGVMLPYTPLHELLMAPAPLGCLVMTSGNGTGCPIEVADQEAVARLGHIADAFLVHDRDIWNRCDDSVGVVRGGRLMLMRRSRGFVPLPVDLPISVEPTLAVGAMFANTYAIAFERRAFLSQHIGDVENMEVLDFLRESQNKLRRWLNVTPKLIAHDLHPDLLPTRFAKEMAADGARLVAVQHHHAHFAAALVASGVEHQAQGLVLDGTGYGWDGVIWGGELLVGTAARVRRAGHIRELPLPGGDAATRRPLRTAIAYLHALAPDATTKDLQLWSRAQAGEAQVVRQMVDRRFNTPRTTSAGRLFDAVSAMLGVCDEASYEGQAAIELEQVARGGDAAKAPLSFALLHQSDGLIIDPQPAIHGIVEWLERGVDVCDLAASFHDALARAVAEAAIHVARLGGPRTVVLCGGVYQNRILAERTEAILREAGLDPVVPGLIPVNDGGLALGQVMVANSAPSTQDGSAVGWDG